MTNLPEFLDRDLAGPLCALEGGCARSGECHDDCECNPKAQDAWQELWRLLIERQDEQD